MARPGQCFISYAHDDHDGFERLLVHVKAVAHLYDFRVCHDRRINPGFYWNDVIMAQVERSDIFVLLVSNGFFASEYIREHELPAMLDRHRRANALVVPVIYRESCWRGFLGNYLQVVPKKDDRDLVPVFKWPDPEEAFAVAANAISKSIEEWFGIDPISIFPPPAGPVMPSSAAPVSTGGRP